MQIEVSLALAHNQWLVYLDTDTPISVEQAWKVSGLCEKYNGKNIEFAIKNSIVNSNYIMQNGDRLECLRPLTIDPKQARRARAKKSGL